MNFYMACLKLNKLNIKKISRYKSRYFHIHLQIDFSIRYSIPQEKVQMPKKRLYHIIHIYSVLTQLAIKIVETMNII